MADDKVTETSNKDSSFQFKQMLFNTLKYEGGLNEKETGGGGISNYGITQDTYNAYNGNEDSSVRDIKLSDVSKIYEEKYYKQPNFDQLPNKVGYALFDFGVNSGSGTATKTLQRFLGLKDDGKIGEKTIAGVNKYIKENGEDSLAATVNALRRQKMERLATENPEKHAKHLRGWYNRVDSIDELISRLPKK